MVVACRLKVFPRAIGIAARRLRKRDPAMHPRRRVLAIRTGGGPVLIFLRAQADAQGFAAVGDKLAERSDRHVLFAPRDEVRAVVRLERDGACEICDRFVVIAARAVRSGAQEEDAAIGAAERDRTRVVCDGLTMPPGEGG